MARNLKNLENETQTLYDLEYGEKHRKTWKMKKKHTVALGISRKQKNLENEKWTVETWYMARIAEKRGKWEMHTVGPGILWKYTEIVEN